MIFVMVAVWINKPVTSPQSSCLILAFVMSPEEVLVSGVMMDSLWVGKKVSCPNLSSGPAFASAAIISMSQPAKVPEIDARFYCRSPLSNNRITNITSLFDAVF